MINSRDAAEDLTQEVFIAAYKKLSSHDSMRCKFSTWLWTIARNKSIKARAHSKIVSHVFLSEPEVNYDAAALTLASYMPRQVTVMKPNI